MFSSCFSTVDICDAPRTSCCITMSANCILKKLMISIEINSSFGGVPSNELFELELTLKNPLY